MFSVWAWSLKGFNCYKIVAPSCLQINVGISYFLVLVMSLGWRGGKKGLQDLQIPSLSIFKSPYIDKMQNLNRASVCGDMTVPFTSIFRDSLRKAGKLRHAKKTKNKTESDITSSPVCREVFSESIM